MNKRLMAFARKTLKSDLAKCTEEQQAKFLTTFTYITTPKPQNVNEAVDRMPDEELEHTMNIVELLVASAKTDRTAEAVKKGLGPAREFYYLSAIAFGVIVQAEYERGYVFAVDEEAQVKIYFGIGKPLNQWGIKDLNEFKTNGYYHNLGRILLNDLATNDIILPGDYIIQDES